MYGLFSTFMVGVMLAHAVLGCCWHHEHGQETVFVTVVDLEEHHGDGCHGCSGHSSGPGKSHDHGLPECGDGKCVFVRLAEDDVPDAPSPFGNSPSNLILLAERFSARGLVIAEPGATRTAPVWAPPALRLHLAKQVLLI